MLDSSPVAFPPVRRPLKRSASTASLPPTPPRTHRKHARGRSRGSCDSDSDENVMLTSDDDDLRGGGHKKRRIGEAIEADEEAFWLGGSAGLKPEAAIALGNDVASTSKSQAAPLLYRRRQAQSQVDVAPVSPPPSHRKPAVVTPKLYAGSATVSPPVTPRMTRSATKRALRDSPDNPFLATPEKHAPDSATPSPNASSANPSPRTPAHEKATVTYVFRGVRRIYQNPLYNHAEDRPFSPPPASKLPIEHPDYSPAIQCAPKLLFPAARRRKGRKAAPRVKGRKRSPSLSADEADPAAFRPMKLNFGDPEKKSTVQTLDQELKIAGEPSA